MNRAKTIVFLCIFGVITNAAFGQYCESAGHTNSSEWIEGLIVTDINHISGADTNGYGDYTSMTATLRINYPENINIDIGGTYTEYVKIWIDFNQNTIFDSTEVVFQKSGKDTIKGSILIPQTAMQGQTRMRVIMKYGSFATDPCVMNLNYGETEDYAVNLIPFNGPPEVAFGVNKKITCDGYIQFTDSTVGSPTSWDWQFGDGNSSTQQHPLHQYTSNGTYSVTLNASNANGSASTSKTDLIQVLTGQPECDTAKVPQTGVGTVQTSCNGNLTDNGGDNNYDNFSDGILTISPNGATYIVLTFSEFNFESGYDYLYIYDGADTSATLIGKFSGSTMPGGGTISSTAPSLTFRQVSDTSITKSGFLAKWECKIISDPPTANFSADKEFTCGVVNFSDSSTNIPNAWLWDFGDNSTSTEKNPTHTYTVNGLYTVKLTATNNNGSNTKTWLDYILVKTDSFICDTIVMTQNSVSPTQTNCAGLISDNGGSENYSMNSKDLVTIDPTGLSTVTLNFHEFDMENNYDFLYVFDGLDTLSPLIGKFTGTSLPNGGTLSSTSSALTLRLTSDNAYAKSGFLAEWNCTPIVNPPVADFISDKSFTCSEVQFSDKSTNAPDTWSWDFGDGATSTEKSPWHQYMNNGKYTVKLTCSNSLGSNTDTKTDFIFVKNDSSVCDTTDMILTGISTTLTECSGNLRDNGGNGNYQSSSNSIISISPTGADQVTLVFKTFETENNYDYLYIYDGADTSATLIGKFSGTSLPNGGVIASTGSSLTLRLTSDSGTNKEGFLLNWFCTIVTELPVADFVGNPLTSCGKVVFKDLSTNVPISWLWEFGDGQSSTIKNPSHEYNVDGVFTVTLKVINKIGSASTTKSAYINVNKTSSLCDTILLPTTGKGTTLTTCDGTIFDSGGASNYQSSTSGSITIAPNSAAKIKLIFNSFEFENNYDYLYIYDGLDVNSPLIGKFTGDSLPKGGTVISTGPAITLKQTSDSGTQKEGFSANWYCEYDSVPPVVEFTGTPAKGCGFVQFKDLTTFGPTSWDWNFGDGATSTLQNPGHQYSVKGNYTVTLTATNPFGSNSNSKNEYIRIAPDSSICDTILIPQSGIGAIQNSCAGNLMDSGGSNDYDSNTDGTITINPNESTPVNLYFSYFDFENNADFLYVYDGLDINSPLIGKYSGTSKPGGGIVSSSANAITIRQTSDGGINKSGFYAKWDCSIITANSKNKYSNDFSFIIIPNPSRTFFKIEMDAFQTQTPLILDIIDMKGNYVGGYNRNINTQNQSDLHFSDINLKPGIYMIMIQNLDHYSYQKLVILE